MTLVSLEQIKQMAQQTLPNAFANGVEIDAQQDLIALGFDSLAMLQLFGAIEQRFDIDIFAMVNSADDYRTLHGLQQLCINAQQAAALPN